MQGTSLATKLASVTPYATVCTLRFLVALLDSSILCARLPTGPPAAQRIDASHSEAQPYKAAAAKSTNAKALLTEYFIPQCVRVVRTSPSAHNKFVAMSALAICLQRTATLVATPDARREQAAPALVGAHDCDPELASLRVSAALAQDLVQLVLENLDDRLKLIPATATQVFATLCALLAKQAPPHAPAPHLPDASSGSVAVAGGLHEVTELVLALPVATKSRYALLCALVPHVGARRVLAQQESLIEECIAAMRGDAASACGDLFKALLTTSHREAAAVVASAAADDGTSCGGLSGEALHEWRRIWVRDVVGMLTWSDATARARAATYTLPAAFQIDPACMRLLLRLVAPASAKASEAGAARWGLKTPVAAGASVQAAVLLLRAGKQAALFDSLGEVVSARRGRSSAANGAHSAANTPLATGASAENAAGGDGDDDADGRVPVAVLEAAGAHRDEVLRLQALELAALHNRTASARPNTLYDLAAACPVAL